MTADSGFSHLEDPWRTVLSSIGDAVIVTDPAETVLFINPAAQALTGWTAGAAEGRPLAELFRLVEEETRAPIESSAARALSAGVSVAPSDAILLSRDGREAPIEQGATPIRDKTATLLGVLIVFRDSTERKAAQAAAMRLAAIVESSEDGIVGKTLKGIITSWNVGAQRIFGYTEEETIGRHISMLIPPDRQDEERDILDKVSRGERISHYETIRVRKDGRHIDISLTISPVKDTHGRIIGASKIARDITPRKQVEREREEALRERQEALELHRSVEERLSVLVEASTTLLGTLQLADVQRAIFDLARRMISADAYAAWRKQSRDRSWRAVAAEGLSDDFRSEALRRSGFAEPEMSPQVAGPVAVENLEEVPWLSRRAVAYQREGIQSMLIVPICVHEELTGTLTFFYRTPHRFRELEIRVGTALANLAAAALNTVELYQEQRRLRGEAEEASRLKEEFLATVSHELRTPLNSILGWARLLRDGTLDRIGMERALETIDRNARSQAQLIEDILDVSRIITGRLRLDVGAVDLPSVIESAIDSVRPAAEAKQIELQSVVDPSAGPIAGDAERLQQVVWNLLSNAVKFTPRAGRVQVRVERINSHVEVAVSDTGIGIKSDFLPYVFDRFRQADSTSTRTYAGLGLGLAIVRHLVELHGGSVRVESAGVGKGATFVVALPVAMFRHGRLPFGETASAGHTALDLGGVRVLLVDDEADARGLLTAMLERYGAQVKTGANTRQALEILAEWDPDILVSDIGMPDEDGYVLIQRVRSLAPDRGGTVPAVALTAYARSEDRRRALAAGFQMHVSKPVEPEELALAIHRQKRRRPH